MATFDQIQKQAEKLEAGGQWGQAAVLWERLSEHDRAIKAFRKAGDGARAARILVDQGRLKEAAATFVSVHAFAQAAELYERVHEYGEAARCLLRAGKREQAALVCEKAGMYVDAAKIYYSVGNYEKAMQLYEKAGDTATAEQIAAQHGVREKQAQVAERARERELEKLLSDPGAFVDERTIVEAVVLFLRKGRLEDAAKLYSHCREDIGFPVITAVAGQKDLETQLAKMFYAAKDYHKAAQVLENLEYWEKAASLYEYSDDFERAAEMYAKAKNLPKSAEMYEKSGKYAEAADLFLHAEVPDRAAVNFERSHNNFMAGKLFYEVGKRTKSLQLLQKVHKSEPGYLDAVRMVGELLAAGGYHDLAIRKYLEAVHDQEVSEGNADVFYSLACLCADQGHVDHANAYFNKLLTFDVGYRDAQEKLTALQAAPAAAVPAVAAPTAQEAAESSVVSMMDGFDFLKETRLFRELSLDEMKAIYHLAEPIRFDSGQVLIEQNRPGRALYVLRGGQVSVCKVTGDEQVVLAQLGPGAPVGEMSLFDDAPTSARVVADEPVDAFELSKENFYKLLSGSDRLALRVYRAFVETLTDRLRQTTQQKVAGQ